MKAYIVNDSYNGKENIDDNYYLITEEGELLASHFCSNKCYAINDLYFKRPERIEEYNKRFSDFAVLYLGDDDMTVEELKERNKKFYMNEY